MIKKTIKRYIFNRIIKSAVIAGMFILISGFAFYEKYPESIYPSLSSKLNLNDMRYNERDVFSRFQWGIARKNGFPVYSSAGKLNDPYTGALPEALVFNCFDNILVGNRLLDETHPDTVLLTRVSIGSSNILNKDMGIDIKKKYRFYAFDINSKIIRDLSDSGILLHSPATDTAVSKFGRYDFKNINLSNSFFIKNVETYLNGGYAEVRNDYFDTMPYIQYSERKYFKAGLTDLTGRIKTSYFFNEYKIGDRNYYRKSYYRQFIAESDLLAFSRAPASSGFSALNMNYRWQWFRSSVGNNDYKVSDFYLNMARALNPHIRMSLKLKNSMSDRFAFMFLPEIRWTYSFSNIDKSAVWRKELYADAYIKSRYPTIEELANNSLLVPEKYKMAAVGFILDGARFSLKTGARIGTGDNIVSAYYTPQSAFLFMPETSISLKTKFIHYTGDFAYIYSNPYIDVFSRYQSRSRLKLNLPLKQSIIFSFNSNSPRKAGDSRGAIRKSLPFSELSVVYTKKLFTAYISAGIKNLYIHNMYEYAEYNRENIYYVRIYVPFSN